MVKVAVFAISNNYVETKSVFKVTGQGVIHMQGLNQIYFVIYLGYEDLMETAT